MRDMAAKRRGYTPVRDEGWSNGKYWSKKARDNSVGGLYIAYCPDCDADTAHEYDMCLPCDDKVNGIKNA